MTGLVTLQQGPLGVAATTLRPVEKPVVERRTRVVDSMGTQLGDAPPMPLQQRQSQQDVPEHFQPVTTPVAPETLLETSMLAAAIHPDEGILAASLSARLGTWEPPLSSLTLRDRRV